ncbi:uncharacterized protein [Engystomops pustulosus]|uniref:uncharacterized protein n=1 Tax=Engystomops pustulosus TaxID=76066 RepID=UPI003AFA14F8
MIHRGDLSSQAMKDTTAALNRLNDITMEDNMLLVTADVEALYTSIRHTDGLTAVKFFLETSNLPRDLSELLLKLLNFILTHNFFTFKDCFFLQTQGTAMGAACAPSYANLFLGAWERKIFLTDPIQGIERVHNWMRYIDDVLFIWQGTLEELHVFMKDLNRNTENIKLTYKAGSEMEFLDIKMKTDKEGKIKTEVFRKQTATNSLLHAESAHIPSTIKGIPVGQFLRLKRICSDELSFEQQAADLKIRFRERGYSRKNIERAYRRAKFTPRKELLCPNEEDKKLKTAREGNATRLITTYNKNWKKLTSTISKYWPILHTDKNISQLITKQPKITARRAQNLKDRLVHSHYIPEKNNPFGTKGPKWGCFPCKNCKACENIQRGDTFWDQKYKKEYKITQYISCKTSGIIYHATCPCGKIYIGLTTREFKLRVGEHIRDIENAKSEEHIESLKTLPRHFKLCHQCNPKGLVFKGIDKLFETSKRLWGRSTYQRWRSLPGERFLNEIEDLQEEVEVR